MVLKRTLLRTTVGTAIGLSLAGCAYESATAAAPAPAVVEANRAAAASVGGIQVASMAPATTSDAATPLVQKGTVIWRLASDETDPAPTPKMAEELRRLHESLAQMQGQVQTSQQVIAQVQTDQQKQAAELRAQTADVITNVASLAKQGMSSMEIAAKNSGQQWDSANRQIAALEDRLQLAEKDRQFTSQQIAELRKLSDENRALASSEVSNVSAALRIYADQQFQQATASTSATIASLAQATNQSLSTLSDQTNRRLGVIWQAANDRAAELAEKKANAVAASVAALEQKTTAERVTPEQIRSISEQTVASATPEFRALALKTMQDSQDYIRTVARTAVQDKQDPAMQTALTEAARDVITKDDKVVFAIRKAVAEELHGIATNTSGGAATQATRLGNDRDRAVAEGDSVELDPNRMRIAQLLAPGSNQPAPDAVQMANLANISPAAGEAPQQGAVAGQPAWSVPGTSLTRSHPRADWMDLRQYKVVAHEDDQSLQDLIGKVLKRAEPFTGPWQVRWKISDENRDVMNEKFSLDVETNFEEFVSYLAQYMVNDRGVKLTFSLFDNERIIVVSD